MPKLVILNPPSEFLVDDRAFLSLGPLQIATMARDIARWEVRVLDLTGHLRRCQHTAGKENGNRGGTSPFLHGADTCEAEVWDHCRQSIEQAAPADVWGFYSMSCHLATNKKLLNLVRHVDPWAETVIGGPHASLDPQSCLDIGFDHVVVAQTGGGGGEAPFLDFLQTYESDAPFNRKVWSVLDAKGRGPKDDSARWPYPDRTLVGHADYHYFLNGKRCASIVSQLGCPFSCTFCSHGPGYTSIRYRPPEHIRAELTHLRTLGYDAVMLYDDEVNIHKHHFETLCGLLSEQGFSWRAFIKANLFTPQQAALAAQSGCLALCTGAEAADEPTLKAIRKASTLDDNTRFVRLCIEHGILPKVFSIVGLPTQTELACYQLRDWLLEMVEIGLRDYDITIYTPYPGTPYYDAPEKYGLTFPHGRLDYAESIVNYKGRPGQYVGHVDTLHLTAEKVVQLREEIDRAVRTVVERKRAKEGSLLIAGDRMLQSVYDAMVIDGG